MTERPPRGPARILHDLVHRPRQFRQFFGVACCVLVTWLGQPVDWLFPFGAAVAVLGALIRLWGSGYVRKNDELATTGPYRFVRHPLYTGNLLIAIGFAAACGLWWSGCWWWWWCASALRLAPLARRRCSLFVVCVFRHHNYPHRSWSQSAVCSVLAGW